MQMLLVGTLLVMRAMSFAMTERIDLDDSPFTEPFCHQITHLIVTIRNTGRTEARVDLTETLMVPLASLFLNLTELDINSSGYRQSFTRLSSANLPAKTCFTSALVRLRIRVETFDDCLYLLDGRLPQLHQLDVQITEMISSKLPPNSEVQRREKSPVSISISFAGSHYVEDSLLQFLL